MTLRETKWERSQKLKREQEQEQEQKPSSSDSNRRERESSASPTHVSDIQEFILALKKCEELARQFVSGYRRKQRDLQKLHDPSQIFDKIMTANTSIATMMSRTRLIPSTLPPSTLADYPASPITAGGEQLIVTRCDVGDVPPQEAILSLRDLVDGGVLLEDDVAELALLYKPTDTPQIQGTMFSSSNTSSSHRHLKFPNMLIWGNDRNRQLEVLKKSHEPFKMANLDTLCAWRLLNKPWGIFEYCVPQVPLGSGCPNVKCYYQWVSILPVACNRPFRRIGQNWLILWAMHIEPLSSEGKGRGVVRIHEPALLWVYLWWFETLADPHGVVQKQASQWERLTFSPGWFIAADRRFDVQPVPFLPTTVLSDGGANSWWKIERPLSLDDVLNWSAGPDANTVVCYEWVASVADAQKFARQLVYDDDVDVPQVTTPLTPAEFPALFVFNAVDGNNLHKLTVPGTNEPFSAGNVTAQIVDRNKFPAYAPQHIRRNDDLPSVADMKEATSKPVWAWYRTVNNGTWLQHRLRDDKGILVETADYRLLSNPSSRQLTMAELATQTRYPLQRIASGWFELRRVRKADDLREPLGRRPVEVITDVLSLWEHVYARTHSNMAGAWLVNRDVFTLIPPSPFRLNPRRPPPAVAADGKESKDENKRANDAAAAVAVQQLSRLQLTDLAMPVDFDPDRRIGKGGNSEGVFRVKVTRPGWSGPEFVAVKRIPMNGGDEAAERAALSKLEHACQPDLLCLENAVVKDGYYYIITEYLHGYVELDDEKVMQNISPSTLHGLARTLIRAVSRLHGLGVAHNDLKPANILVQVQPAASPLLLKIIDYGWACFGKSSCRKLCGNPQIATIYYTAPEMIYVDECTLGAFQSSDIWSLGMVLFDLISPNHEPYWYLWGLEKGRGSKTIFWEMRKRKKRVARVALSDAVAVDIFLAGMDAKLDKESRRTATPPSWTPYHDEIYALMKSMLRYNPDLRRLPS